MLLKLEDVEKFFQCPILGQPLVKEHDCYYSKKLDQSQKYQSFNGFPVLVDFSKSLLVERSADGSTATTESPIERVGRLGLRGFGSKLVAGNGQTTRENVNRLMEQLETIENPIVLVVGGGSVGNAMEEIYRNERIKVVAFDIYGSPNVQFIADAHQIPLCPDTFDAVIIQAVLEHVLEPAKVVEEIWRVLKPNGIVYSETPFMQQVHEGAYDFTRFTESGHRFLFRRFSKLKSGAVNGPALTLLWSLDYFFSGVFRSRKIGKAFKLLFFWVRFLERFIPPDFAIDGACGVYFMGRKRDATMTPREAVEHYQGHQS